MSNTVCKIEIGKLWKEEAATAGAEWKLWQRQWRTVGAKICKVLPPISCKNVAIKAYNKHQKGLQQNHCCKVLPPISCNAAFCTFNHSISTIRISLQTKEAICWKQDSKVPSCQYLNN